MLLELSLFLKHVYAWDQIARLAQGGLQELDSSRTKINPAKEKVAFSFGTGANNLGY